MTGTDELEELRRLMPPRASSNASDDWGRMRESQGSQFPSDCHASVGLPFLGRGSRATLRRKT